VSGEISGSHSSKYEDDCLLEVISLMMDAASTFEM
jgi:hypothetical protein